MWSLMQIINGSIYLVGPTVSFQSRARTIQLQLMDLQSEYDLPDMDVVLTTSDKCKPADKPHRSFDGNLDRCQRLVSPCNPASGLECK